LAGGHELHRNREEIARPHQNAGSGGKVVESLNDLLRGECAAGGGVDPLADHGAVGVHIIGVAEAI